MTGLTLKQLTGLLPVKIWKGHISDGSFSVRIEKTENERGIYFVYFRLDGIVHVGISDNGWLTAFKVSKNQNALDCEPCIPVRTPLRRIGDTDETFVGKKRIKLRKRIVHMRDHKDLQPFGVEETVVIRDKREVKRIKRLEQSRAEQLISPNTAQVKTYSPVEPELCPVIVDEFGDAMPKMSIDNPTYDKFKCPACRTERKTMGYCQSCVDKTEKTLAKLNRELSGQ